tara:strand:+ start:4301 stop:4906 length:606 start_codon:yes stop_codon:yes gene_type:complete
MAKHWVIARGPANKEFKLHDHISRPKLGYERIGNKRIMKYGRGPHCYTPVEMRYYIKGDIPTERPIPLMSGYTFIQDPSYKLIEALREQGRIYGLLPDPRGADYGPYVLSQRAIDLYRAKYETEYDPDTGSGHKVVVKPEAFMQKGYEFEPEDYVVTDDPAWIGHRLFCIDVLDTTARVLISAFGGQHEVEMEIRNLKKAS